MTTPTMRSPHEVVADEVRAALARRRISGRAAARELGWTSDYIHRRLDGRTALDANDLVALARLLDVPVASFFAGLEPAPNLRRIDMPGAINPANSWPYAA